MTSVNVHCSRCQSTQAYAPEIENIYQILASAFRLLLMASWWNVCKG